MGLPNVARHSPEILAVRLRDGAHFLVVQMLVAGQVHRFEIPVDVRAAVIMRRVLQTRPFEDLPSARYRYFFSGGYTYSQRQDRFSSTYGFNKGETMDASGRSPKEVCRAA